MDRLEWTFLDKSVWGKGPWLREPDKVQWPDPDTGLPCLAVRHPESGHWCGYVGVPPGHPYYRVQYDDLAAIRVHGGLTFTNTCQQDREHGICHTPAPGEEEHVWWLGFDCAHAGDLSPRLEKLYPHSREVYRTLEYVQAECASLAAQLKQL